MAFRRIFVLVIFAFAVDALDLKNCDESSPIKIHKINLSPHPLRLKKGEKATLSGEFAVAGAAGKDYKLQLKVQKKIGWFGYATVKTFPEKDITCDKFVGSLEGAQCPLKHGIYVLKEQELTLPDVSIPSFLLNGNYKVIGDLRDKENKQRISCVEVMVDITA